MGQLVVERFAEFSLGSNELDNMTEWALLVEPVEYITIPDGSADRLKIAIRRAGGAVDQGSAVGAGRAQAELDRICEVQRQLVSEVQILRTEAVEP